MNKGKLPDFYSFFNVEVYDDFSQKTLGSLLIKASSDKYHSRGMLIYLYQGDSQYALTWKNDAYKKGEYDANIQIKSVRLRYKRYIRQRKNLNRSAAHHCGTSGRWFFEKKAIYTFWGESTS